MKVIIVVAATVLTALAVWYGVRRYRRYRDRHHGRPWTNPKPGVYRSVNAHEGERTTRDLWARMRRNRHPLSTDDGGRPEPPRQNLNDLWR